MKKSLILGVPAALVLALLFAGCPTEAEEDSGGSGFKGSYQKDVDGIAVAFADGADTVYLKDNLHLGNDELVVPVGKTLDISNEVTIDQIGANGKIVVVGNIQFTNVANRYDIALFKAPTAKLIATKAFIDGNVEVLASETAASLDTAKHVKVLSDQVIQIAEFNIASASEWEKYIDEATGTNAKYIPVRYSGEIGEDIANNISKYGKNRRVYIIADGDITLSSEIDLVNKEGYSLSTFNSGTPLYNVYQDDDSSLLIAGAVTVKGYASVTTGNGGFTVLGTLATSGENITINKAGNLIAYILRLDKTGATFQGPVTLIGTLPSNFGEGAFFYDDLTVNGSAIITSVSFIDSHALFKGPVEFKGDSKSVSTKSTDATKKSTTITLSGPVSLTNSDPVDITSSTFNITGDNASITYDIPYENKTAADTAAAGGSVTFKVPVRFNETAKFAGSAVTLVFEKGATFNKAAAFTDDATLIFLGAPTTFAKPITIRNLGGGSFGAAVTFNEDTVIDTKAVFNGLVTTNGKFDLSLGGTFKAGAKFNGDVKVPAGSAVTVHKEGVLDYKGLVKLVSGNAAGSSVINFDTVPLDLSGDALNIGAGSLTLGTASIDISDGGKIVFNSGTVAAGTYGIVLKGPADTEFVKADNYTITAKSAKDVWLTSGTSSGPVVLLKDSIRNSAGSQGILALGGTYGYQNVLFTLSKDIEIEGVALDLRGGGTITVGGAADVVITLKGGTVAAGAYVTGGGSASYTPSATSAGGIVVGGTASIGVFGAGIFSAIGTNPTSVPTGYLVASSGKFATAVDGAGTVTAAGSIGTLGNTTETYITGGSLNAGTYIASQFFTNFYVPVDNANGAKGIVSNMDTPKSASNGSIAVFKSN
jgi:hypothetical protein